MSINQLFNVLRHNSLHNKRSIYLSFYGDLKLSATNLDIAFAEDNRSDRDCKHLAAAA